MPRAHYRRVNHRLISIMWPSRAGLIQSVEHETSIFSVHRIRANIQWFTRNLSLTESFDSSKSDRSNAKTFDERISFRSMQLEDLFMDVSALMLNYFLFCRCEKSRYSMCRAEMISFSTIDRSTAGLSSDRSLSVEKMTSLFAVGTDGQGHSIRLKSMEQRHAQTLWHRYELQKSMSTPTRAR